MILNKRLTVLMPVYNAEKYLKAAIQSILNQTYTDFDILIIDDGSTDSSEEIIRQFKDERIKFIQNEKNLGIVDTLNRGLQLIEGDYIARMDSDDISLPERFEKQLAFMDENQDIAVAGTSIRIFDDQNQSRDLVVETDPKKIRTQLIFDAALKHPTVIIRNRVLKENNYLYDKNHKATEDLGLWQKISFDYDLGNVKEILMDYRDNEMGITRTAEKNREERDMAHMRVYEQLFKHLKLSYSQKELYTFRQFIAHSFDFTDESCKELASVLSQMRNAMNPSQYDLKFFDKKVSTYYRNNALNQSVSIPKSIKIHKKYFEQSFDYLRKEKIKFVLKKYRNILKRS